jgi:hypothetical protein
MRDLAHEVPLFTTKTFLDLEFNHLGVRNLERLEIECQGLVLSNSRPSLQAEFTVSAFV